MIKDILTEHQKNKKMIAIYVNTDERENFAVGYVVNVVNDQLLFLNVGLHGEFDGYTAAYIDDIYRVENDSRYIKKMQQLCSFDLSNILKIEKEQSAIMSLINTAFKDNGVIKLSVVEKDNVITGYIVEKNDKFINVLQLDEYGTDDGNSIIEYDDIIQVCYADLDCYDMQVLHKKT